MVDLGVSPLCQTVIRPEQLGAMEPFYPLHVRVCTSCWLAQLPELVTSEDLFVEYAYFSAYADSWVEHARRYVEMISDRLTLGPDDLVVELASNDGYLLQHFLPKGIPVLGIDPAQNVAEAAIARGVPTLTEFFGLELATRLVAEGRAARLVLGNNVLAQIPDLNDFVAGVKVLLADGGTATFEVPHLARLISSLAYDTIYHEHFSYFSLHSLRSIFGAAGLALVDVEELPTHGGSLRVYLRHADERAAESPHVARVLAEEESAGLRDPETYVRFAEGVAESKRALLELLIALNRQGRQVVGYGAPGKGNTLLNYCGIRSDLVRYTVDRNPYKQNAFTPGTRIPIHAPERIADTRPDAILILPWNLATEITAQLAYTAEWGAMLITPIPTARTFPAGAPPGRSAEGASRLDAVLGGEASRAALEAASRGPGPPAPTEDPGLAAS